MTEREANSVVLWQAIEPFGSEQPDNKIKQAFYEFGRFFQLMDGWRYAMYGPLAQKPNWQQLREDIQSFDNEVFIKHPAPYFQSTHKDINTLQFSGNWQHPSKENNYDFTISPPNETVGLADNFGAMTGEIRLSPGSLKPENLLLDSNFSINLDTILFSEMLASMEAINMQFSAEQLAQKSWLAEIEASNHRLNRTMSESDQEIMARFIMSLPELMLTLSTFSEFEQFAEFSNTPSGLPASLVQPRIHINLKSLKKAFPDSYADYKRLLKGFSYHTEVLTDQDELIGRFAYDARKREVSADLALVNGGFGLKDQHGVLLDKVIYPTRLESLNHKIVSSFNISILGLKVDVNKLMISARYDAGLDSPVSERKASLSFAMADLPEINVSGAFLYIIPAWLIDLFIPGTIETLIADAFEDVIKGNKGKGMEMALLFRESRQGQILDIELTSELPYQVLQSLLEIKEDNETSIDQRLYRTLRTNLRQDYAHHARQFNTMGLDDFIQSYLP